MPSRLGSVARTDSPSTPASKASPSTSRGQACDNKCSHNGLTATCGARIRWSSLHITQEERSPCEAAKARVASQCWEECADCSLAEAMCSQAVEVESMPVVKRFEEVEAW